MKVISLKSSHSLYTERFHDEFNILSMIKMLSFTVGDIIISDDITLSGLNQASPQFTLTCISTSGPATTVTWTRDSGDAVGVTNTELDNRMNAQYTHTLTVTGRLVGLYTCTVTNDKPSSASATITVEGI